MIVGYFFLNTAPSEILGVKKRAKLPFSHFLQSFRLFEEKKAIMRYFCARFLAPKVLVLFNQI